MLKASPVIASTTTRTVCSASDTRTSVCVNLTGKPAHSRHSIDKDSRGVWSWQQHQKDAGPTPCHQCLTDTSAASIVCTSVVVWCKPEEGGHVGPKDGFTDCYCTKLETALSPTNYVLLHAKAYNLSNNMSFVRGCHIIPTLDANCRLASSFCTTMLMLNLQVWWLSPVESCAVYTTYYIYCTVCTSIYTVPAKFTCFSWVWGLLRLTQLLTNQRASRPCVMANACTICGSAYATTRSPRLMYM